LVVELKARIAMSPLNLLVTAIMQYEAQFGKIVVPPGIGLPTEENDKTKGVELITRILTCTIGSPLSGGFDSSTQL